MNKSRLKQALKKVTDELHANLAKAIIGEPNRTYRQLAEDFGVSEATVLLAASRYKLSRTPGPKPATRKKEQTNE